MIIDLSDERNEAARTVVEFCRFARESGLTAGMQETLDALRVAALVGVFNRRDLRLGLRSVLCSSKDDWDLFDRCFQMFWSAATFPEAEPSRVQLAGARNSRERDGARAAAMIFAGPGNAASSGTGDGAQAATGASASERLTTVDFSSLPQEQMEALEQVALRLFRQMSRRLARKQRSVSSRGQVDLRKTIRRNIGAGGEPIRLQYRRRRPRPSRLVTLLDVSGSMSPYSLFLVKFLYALQKHFQHVDTFLFSTRLVEITGLFRAARLHDAMLALSQQATGWSGGTKIGGSLEEFNQTHKMKLRSADTLFLILSDGWDVGEPGILAKELGAVKRRVRKLIWLNPLLGMKDYQPITAGMKAALPYVDIFGPAHNLESLLALEKHL